MISLVQDVGHYPGLFSVEPWLLQQAFTCLGPPEPSLSPTGPVGSFAILFVDGSHVVIERHDPAWHIEHAQAAYSAGWHREGTIDKLNQWVFLWANVCPTALQGPDGLVLPSPAESELVVVDNRQVAHQLPALSEGEIAIRQFITVRLHDIELTSEMLQALRRNLDNALKISGFPVLHEELAPPPDQSC